MLRIKNSNNVHNYRILQEVKPCPFCGSDYSLLELWSWFVTCPVCKTKGPSGNSEEEAIKLWNDRFTGFTED